MPFFFVYRAISRSTPDALVDVRLDICPTDTGHKIVAAVLQRPARFSYRLYVSDNGNNVHILARMWYIISLLRLLVGY